MKTLDLTRLNLVSPYTFWYIGNDTYSFLVRRGQKVVTYRVGFVPNESIWEEGAYEFFITNDSHEPSPNDPKIRQSVVAIIEEFFYDNPDVLLYQCDTSENPLLGVAATQCLAPKMGILMQRRIRLHPLRIKVYLAVYREAVDLSVGGTELLYLRARLFRA